MILGSAVVILLLATPAGSNQDLAIEAQLGQSVFEACGLHKLEPQELAQLALYLTPPDLQSFEIESALAYLEGEGWEPVTLYAGVPENPESSFSDIRHLAFTAERQLILNKWLSSNPELPAGHYLGKVGPFNVEILDVYGQVQRLRIEDD
jgi:hypothetical protein